VCYCVRCQCTYANGDVYSGDWEFDNRHGEGTLDVAPDPDFPHGEAQYQGPFVLDRRSGTGVCTYVDGGRYDGTWKNDLRHGTGVMTYGDGTQYSGDWELNMRHGQGSCKFGNGDEYKVGCGSGGCGVM